MISYLLLLFPAYILIRKAIADDLPFGSMANNWVVTALAALWPITLVAFVISVVVEARTRASEKRRFREILKSSVRQIQLAPDGQRSEA